MPSQSLVLTRVGLTVAIGMLSVTLQGGLIAHAQDELMPLPNQKYALCAGALSFNFDGITYAKCRKLRGDSVTLTHAYPPGVLNKNIETVNKIGTAPNNRSFRVSTYSPPNSSIYAVYECTEPGAYAQCDGGLCFENTSGKPFPGVGPVARHEIICSCPIVTTDSVYHVTGPAACPTTLAEYNAVCGAGAAQAQTADGVILRIGSSGPADTQKAQDDYYDQQFGTTSTMKKCERPAG